MDTAGRLQIDDEMMDELKRLKAAVRPHEILLVADGMTGQDAVRIAKGFHDALGITGVVLTKMDGDARGVPRSRFTEPPTPRSSTSASESGWTPWSRSIPTGWREGSFSRATSYRWWRRRRAR